MPQPKDAPTKTVEAISRLHITGNVVPREWLQRLKMPNGTPDAIGALVLAEIVFWYCWTPVRDENSQLILRYKKKFKADKLQKSYQQLSDALGFSKQQVKDAIIRLEEPGLITKELRSLKVAGTWIANAMFLEPVPIAIDLLTFDPIHPDIDVEQTDSEEVIAPLHGDTEEGMWSPDQTPRSTDHTLYVHRPDVYIDHSLDHPKNTVLAIARTRRRTSRVLDKKPINELEQWYATMGAKGG